MEISYSILEIGCLF